MGNGIGEETTTFKQLKKSTSSFKLVISLAIIIATLVTFIATKGGEKALDDRDISETKSKVEILIKEDHMDEIEKVANDVEDLFEMMNESKQAIKDNVERDEARADQLTDIDKKLALLIQKVEALIK